MANDFESKRIDKMVEVLSDLNDDDIMSLFCDANSWNGGYEFVDGQSMDEFLTVMVEGKNGSELVDFIMEVASAINDYNGSDGIENAAWGYPDIYGLEIRDRSDIAEQGREDYLNDLAADIIKDGCTSKFGVLPSEVEELLDEFDSEDSIDWQGAGDYVAWDGDTEVARRHFNDFDSYYKWTESDELSDCDFECAETDA